MRAIDAGPLARAHELEALGYLHMAVQPRSARTPAARSRSSLVATACAADSVRAPAPDDEHGPLRVVHEPG